MASLLDNIDANVLGEIVDFCMPRFGGLQAHSTRLKILNAFTPSDLNSEDAADHTRLLEEAEPLWPIAIMPDAKYGTDPNLLWPTGFPKYFKRINEVVIPNMMPEKCVDWVLSVFESTQILCLAFGDPVSKESAVKLLSKFTTLEWLCVFPDRLKDITEILPPTLVELKISCTNGEANTHVPLLLAVINKVPKADIDIIVPPKAGPWIEELKNGFSQQGKNIEVIETPVRDVYSLKVLE
jgi:hypothetical protein